MPLTRRQIHHDDIERRLTQWAREYGYGGEKNLGWSPQNILAKGGMPLGDRIPPGHIRTDADKVHDAVTRLEREGWAKMQVLRLHYFRPGIAMPERLDMLARIGIRIGKSTYYDWLAYAVDAVADEIYRTCTFGKNP